MENVSGYTERERMRRHAERPVTSNSAPPDQVQSNPSTSYTISSTDSGYHLKYEFLRKRYEDDRYSINKNITILPEQLVADLVPEPEAPLALHASSTVAFVSRWLECCESHNTCPQRRESKSFVPTRLIDVGSPGSMDISLHITDGSLDPNGDTRYMTLSHCWGSLKIKTLQTRSLEAMKQGIELSALPKTFQDAIQITRALGVRYIWIDSLCIIQDEPKDPNVISDWFKESARMGDIYANSYLNIAATAAKDGSEGLFFPRNVITAHPFLVQATWTGLEPGTYCLVDDSMWSREVDEAPLNQRAWVFQERFLSTRNLSFGAKRLFWECGGMRACETFPGGLPGPIKSVEFKVSNTNELNKLFPVEKKKKKKADKDAVDPAALKAWLLMVTGAHANIPQEGGFAGEQQGVPNAYRQWTTVITHYSKGQLTKESDRLIALYGVAQWMREKLIDDEYVAGLWKKHLLNHLLWMTYPNLKKQRPADYRAPSWSWASVIGKVSFRDILEAEDRDKIAQILEVVVTTVDGKEGQVSGGFIRIMSQVLEGTWTRWGSAAPNISRSAKASVSQATLWDNEWTANPTANFTFDTKEKKSGITGFPDMEPDDFEAGVTTCVIIQQRTKSTVGAARSSWSCIVEGLVLKRDSPETFKRIGCFTAHGDGAEYILAKCGERELKIV
ncbi:unnamed protein product [Clonostachys chloroleuca]|uniref:Heterokaryon incompatibility domain-containing protein n=1 Tax=Clonostachys chloroleuca TaxID=1926264 RepID=A0AA35M1X3_9HYPO|nr:unnamed protein product [Clonostachys chloroleuca]